MAIKATTKDRISKALEYPKLMKFIGNEEEPFIVLFSREGHGMVIKSGNEHRKIGHYSTKWNDESFEDFNGTVELTNDIK